MNIVKTCLVAGALCMAAGNAMAITKNLRYDGAEKGLATINYKLDDASSRNVLAGSFFMETTSGPLERFLVWCVEITDRLTRADYDFAPTGPLDSDQLGRLQKLFDANYDGETPATTNESAAMQAAVWELVYDDDFSVSTQGGTDDGFMLNTTAAIIDIANGYLEKAEDYVGGKRWGITQLEAVDPSSSQNLITVTAVPLPGAALLLGSAFLGAGVVSARRRRDKAA